MCGITGLFFLSSSKQNYLETSAKLIAHRGPDEYGFFKGTDASLGIARLSIVDVQGGSQPLYSEDERIVVVGNGEIYNHRELRQSLTDHLISSQSDMDVVPHLYEDNGIDVFGMIRGMYGIALFDQRTETGYLVRDPSGIKPLYYAEVNGGVVFGSEIKSILPYLEDVSYDIGEISRALLYRSSSSTDTCFKGIKKVPRSTILKITSKGIELIPYRPLFSDSPLNVEDAMDLSITRRLMADVPVGSFLSGGLDSSLISSMMKMKLGQNYDFHTFSVGYGIEGDEFNQARLVSEHIKSIHHEVVVDTSDIIRDFDKIVWHMDEPTLNPAIIPSFYLSKEAAKYVKVVLVGDGADEVFVGYDKHRELLKMYNTGNINPQDFFSRRMPFSFEELEASGITVDKALFSSWEEEMKQSQSAKAYLRAALRVDREEMLPNLQLMTVDRSTMAHSLEARVPFLDVDLVRASMNLEISDLISDDSGKIPLREIARNLLPDKVTYGKKKIYFVPIDHWMEQGLDDFVQERIFSSKILSEILNIEILKISYSTLSSYQKWSLAVVDSWYRTFFGS